MRTSARHTNADTARCCEYCHLQLPCQTEERFQHDPLATVLRLANACACSARPASHCAANSCRMITSIAAADFGCSAGRRGSEHGKLKAAVPTRAGVRGPAVPGLRQRGAPAVAVPQQSDVGGVQAAGADAGRRERFVPARHRPRPRELGFKVRVLVIMLGYDPTTAREHHSHYDTLGIKSMDALLQPHGLRMLAQASCACFVCAHTCARSGMYLCPRAGFCC